MASPAIIWRNPNRVRCLRTWTRVRREGSRSLYLVLESPASGPASWGGLPTLEIIKKRAGVDAAATNQNLRTGA